MKAILQGKLLSHSFVNGSNYYIVAEAAKDVYSQPQSFKVKSDTELGAVNSEVRLSLEIGGYIKSKPYKDKVTQQPKVFEEQIIYLNASIATPAELKQAS